MWLRVFEAYLTKQLLESPSFHRAIGSLHRNVRRLRDGVPPEELGGTKLERKEPGFVQHFLDELKNQASGKTKQ